MLANLAAIQELLAREIPDREAFIWRDRRFSFADLNERCRRVARAFQRLGLGCRRERESLEAWQSGQDHVGLYLHNGNEYLEAMCGALHARAVPVNVNYRYVADELVFLLGSSRARALVYHACFASTVDAIRSRLPELETLVQVEDGSGAAVLHGALEYENLLDSETSDPLEVAWSPDDLFIIYTGGTTGFPKGVLWRQEDIFFNLFGGHVPGFPKLDTDEALLEFARVGLGGRMVVAMPFMHGAGVGSAFNTWHRGGTVVLPDEARRLDPHSYWEAVERHRVETISLIGDAFALPLIRALGERSYDVSSVRVVTSTAAVLSPSVKAELLALLPETVMIVESLGSTETGFQAMSTLAGADAAGPAAYQPREGTVLLSADRTRVLDPACASGEIGWTARMGHLPLGYLGEPEKTRETFPTIGRVRYAIAGDRAHYDDQGRIVLLGREATCVNTGGEKVYVEEVERVVKSHPAIFDALVVGRSSERWGQEVTAVVSLRAGAAPPGIDEIHAHCASHLAGYKIPRAIVVAPAIIHLANGKPDYAWAKELACSRVATPS